MNEASRPTVFIDIDGTLFDTFKEDDHKIIDEIFGKNIFIRIIDSILWKINSMDLISNSMKILMLRFFIYSIFSFKRFSYITRKYERLYKKYLINAINRIDKEKLETLDKNYNVIIITNNPFSVDISKDYFKNVLFCKHNFHRIKSIAGVCSKDSKVKYFVGNNYQDDIHASKKLGGKSIYVGKSRVVKKMNPSKCVCSFIEALDYLIILCR